MTPKTQDFKMEDRKITKAGKAGKCRTRQN